MRPARLVRPNVGLNPITPHTAAGNRIDPPESVPSPPKMVPAAVAAAVPLLLPDALYRSSNGFPTSLTYGLPIACSWRVVLPITTAPASRRRRTASASWREPDGGGSLEAQVVGK